MSAAYLTMSTLSGLSAKKVRIRGLKTAGAVRLNPTRTATTPPATSQRHSRVFISIGFVPCESGGFLPEFIVNHDERGGKA